jgi:hypothetical protein
MYIPGGIFHTVYATGCCSSPRLRASAGSKRLRGKILEDALEQQFIFGDGLGGEDQKILNSLVQDGQ